MRIGLLTDVYRIGFSGVANHVMLLRQSFQQLGYEVCVFAFERAGNIHAEPGLYFSPGMVVKANYPFGFRLSRDAARAIQAMDILHVHQPFASGSIALRQSRRSGAPVVFTSHTRYDLYMKAYLPQVPIGLSTAAVRAYMRGFARSTSLIVAPSAEMEAMLRSWRVQAKIQVIPNGIDISAFETAPAETATIRKKLGLTDEAFVYLYAGRIATEKNITLLLKSFEIVRQQEPGSALVLVGGGPNFAAIGEEVKRTGLEDGVKMTGPVAYSEMPAYMHAANAFVTASKTEVHPLTLIEAAAAGLPAVAVDAQGVRSIVRHEVTGYLCPEDTDLVAEKMLLLARRPELAAQMRQNAREEACGYSHMLTAQRVLDAYQSILSEKQASRER